MKEGRNAEEGGFEGIRPPTHTQGVAWEAQTQSQA